MYQKANYKKVTNNKIKRSLQRQSLSVLIAIACMKPCVERDR